MFILRPFQPVLLDNIHKVSVAPLPEVLGAKRDECRVVHAHGSSAPRLLLLLLQHLTQRRLAVVQGLQLRAEQAVQSLGATPCRNRRGTLQIWGVLRWREGREKTRIYKEIMETCFGNRLAIINKYRATVSACVCGTLYLGLMEFYFFELLLSPSFCCCAWVNVTRIGSCPKT